MASRKQSDADAPFPRTIHLPSRVYDRLQLFAILKQTTVSDVVTEILDKSIPHLRIQQD